MYLERSGSKSGFQDTSVLNWKSLGKWSFKGARELGKKEHETASEEKVLASEKRKEDWDKGGKFSITLSFNLLVKSWEMGQQMMFDLRSAA